MALGCSNPSCEEAGRIQHGQVDACPVCGESLAEVPNPPSSLLGSGGIDLHASSRALCLSCGRELDVGEGPYCDACADDPHEPVDYGLREDDEPRREPVGAPPFYVPLGKLLTLSLLTFNLYTVYWTYKSWRVYRPGSGIFFAAVAALTPPLSCFLLFSSIADRQQRLGRSPFPAILTAVAHLLALVLPEVAYDNLAAPGWVRLLPLVSMLPLAVAQDAANGCVEPKERISPWSLGNTLAVLPGLLLWVLLIAALAGALG